MRPAGPAICSRTVRGVIASALSADVGRQQQALDDLAALQVRVDDLVDVALVDVGVPDALGIDDRDRAAGAAVEAAGLVDAHLAGPGSSSFFTRDLQWSKPSCAPLWRSTTSRRSRAR